MTQASDRIPSFRHEESDGLFRKMDTLDASSKKQAVDGAHSAAQMLTAAFLFGGMVNTDRLLDLLQHRPPDHSFPLPVREVNA